MNAFFGQIKQIWGNLPTAQKVLIGGLGGLVLLGGVVAVLVGGSTDWRTLGSGMDGAEAQKLLTKLDESNVPYRLQDSGRSVQVPADRWDEVQSLMVRNDLVPGRKSNGYDALDNMPFGMTDRQRDLKMRVATERELAMTITDIDGIESAKIHITPAKRSWNKRDSTPAKASVVVRSRPGRVLPPSSVEAVVQLVAGAVPGLEPKRVVVSDASLGVVLSRPEGAGTAYGSDRFRQHEQRLQEKAESALARALGEGKAVVRVDAELDLERVDTTESVILPDSKVVTKERSKTTENRTDEPKGNVSTAAVQAGGQNRKDQSSSSEETEASYEFSRRTVHRVKDLGTVKRLTVGVLVDEEFKDRSDAIANVVKGAVGFKPERDFFEVSFVPFAEIPALPAPPEPAFWENAVVLDFAKWGVTALVGLGIVFFLWRSARRAREGVKQAIERTMEHRRRGSERKEDPKQEILEMVDDDVEAVGNTLRNWLYEPVGK